MILYQSNPLNRLPPLPRTYKVFHVFHFHDSGCPVNDQRIVAKDREHAIAIAEGDKLGFDSVENEGMIKVQSDIV
jgi:hypothetical protein